METSTEFRTLLGRVDQALERATGLALPEIFAPPANETAIAATERTIGVRLPADLRQAYLWHDGFRHFAGAGPKKLTGMSLIPGFHWFSLANLVYRWQQDRDIEMRRVGQESVLWQLPRPNDTKETTAVRHQEYDQRWIPVAVSSNRTYAYVDLNPNSSGTAGQVFELWGGGWSNSTVKYHAHRWIANSFADCLAPIPDALEAGRLIYFGGRGWVLARTGNHRYRVDALF